MEVYSGPKPIDGMVEREVIFKESINNLGHTIRVSVWVKENDSIAELKKSARIAARELLARALDQTPDESDQ